MRTEMNNVILECPRCLNMFMAYTFRVVKVGERTWGTKCRCGNIIEFSFDCMDPWSSWLGPKWPTGFRKINGYPVRVEGLTYSKTRD